MKNILLVIEYEGSNYHGWQKQPGLLTIQGELEKALFKATKEEVELIGSGRTDKSVHALGQVANFKTNCNIPGHKYKYLMDFLLPDDISIMDSMEVDLDFHSRFDAKGKIYRYRVYNGKLPRAILRNFTYYYPYELDIEKMQRAAEFLIGTHDFSSFKVERSDVHSSIRTIYSIDIVKTKDVVEFIIDGKSFLHNMVRIIVGTLLYIGSGKFKVDYIQEILSKKNRAFAGITAPAQGLYLEKVYYD